MSPESPYKGLVPFEDTELDALLFFGRERESGIIAANVLASRLTVLYGASGVGKSSVLRAGVVHRLRRQSLENVDERGHPEFVVLVFDGWTDDPVASLRAVARDALTAQFGSALLDEQPGESLANTLGRWTDALACDLLLVLDQAEEYFLYHGEDAGFTRDLPALVTRPGLRVRVLLAVREDALAKLDRFKGRIPNLFSNYLRLDHLDRPAAREAIVKPVERYNELAGASVSVEPELVDAVLDQTATGKVDLGEVGRGLGSGKSEEDRVEAPYLQLVMERLWEEERAVGSQRLRAETLARLGGAEAIVQAHLLRAVEGLSSEQKDVAAEVFRYLVTPSGMKIAHGVVDLAEYASVEEESVRPVLATLGRERILRAVDGGGVGTDGGRFEIFHDVLAESVLAWRREQELDRERRSIERRHRRLLALFVAALFGLAAMTAVAIYAFSKRAEANDQRGHAQARALVAESVNELGVDSELSLLLGLKAAAIEHTPQVENVLRDALEASRVRSVRETSKTEPPPAPPDGRLRVAGKLLPRGGIEAVAYSPDGRLIATGHGDKTARIWSRRTGRQVRVLRGHVGHVIAVAFSPDGTMLATGSSDGTGGLWRLADGYHVATLIGGHTGFITAVAFNPRGDLVATGSHDRTIRIWDTAAGRPFLVLTGHRDRVTRLRFSREGSRLFSWSTDGTERTWDPEPEPRMHVVAAGRLRESRDVSAANGRRASIDGNAVVVRDTRRGSVITLRGHTKPVTSVRFDRTGRRIVTTSEDGDARIWDPASGATLHLLRGHFGVVNDAGFSPDGRWVVTAGPFSVGLWRSDGDTIHTFIRNTDRPVRVWFADQHRIVSVARDGREREWYCDICGPLAELVPLAERRLALTGRTLTTDESRLFPGG